MSLRRVVQHFRKLEWTAIAIDLLIVIVGVFIGMQVSNWNVEREASRKACDADARDAFVAASIIAYQSTRAARRANFYSDTAALSRERIPPSQGQQIDLTYQGQNYRLKVYAIGSWRYRVHMEGRVVAASMREEGSHRARLVIGNRAPACPFEVVILAVLERPEKTHQADGAERQCQRHQKHQMHERTPDGAYGRCAHHRPDETPEDHDHAVLGQRRNVTHDLGDFRSHARLACF